MGTVGDVAFVLYQSDEVYLEAGVQNITSGPLCLEKVELEPSPYFSGEVLSTTMGLSRLALFCYYKLYQE